MRGSAVVGLILVGACVAPFAEVVELPPQTTTTSVAVANPTTSSTVATTTTGPLPSTTTLPSPLALISPSGVPVPILRTEGRLHTVLTPCGNERPLARGTPLFQTDVVIDPGHGGEYDTGATARSGLPEKDVNLRVALALQELLTDRGIASILTRTADYPSRLFVRARLADAVEAKLMVSIHHNAPNGFRSETPGTEVFIQRDSAESARLGGLLYQYTMDAYDNLEGVDWTAAGDAGVMTVLNPEGDDAYGIIRMPETPTALIELGYMSNPTEARLFSTDAYPYVAAHALARAIEAYLGTAEQGSGFGPGRTFRPLPGISANRCVDPDLG